MNPEFGTCYCSKPQILNRNLHFKYLIILTKFQMLHLVGVLFFNKTYLLHTLLEALTT